MEYMRLFTVHLLQPPVFGGEGDGLASSSLWGVMDFFIFFSFGVWLFLIIRNPCEYLMYNKEY